MAMKKKPGEHPRVEDFNRIYGARHVHRLAAAHKSLKRRFRVGDHVEHVPGIKDEEVRYWRAHMRMLPQLARSVLRDAIDHCLTATPPLPIQWVIKRRSAGGWSIAITEQRGRVTIEVAPPALREPATKRKSRAS
jgi:hypothetical protein